MPDALAELLDETEDDTLDDDDEFDGGSLSPTEALTTNSMRRSLFISTSVFFDSKLWECISS